MVFELMTNIGACARPAAVALLRELLLDENDAIRLDWLSDLLDLYKARKMIKVTPPNEVSSLEPGIKKYIQSNGSQESENGSIPQQLEQREASAPESYDAENSRIFGESSVMPSSNGHSMNGTGTNLDSGEAIGRNGSNGLSSTSTHSEENSSNAKRTAFPLQQQHQNRKVSHRSKSKKLAILDMVLSRPSHGFRRILIECDVVKLLNTLHSSEGEKWRLLLASSLRTMMLGGLKSATHLPLKVLIKLWKFITAQKESRITKQVSVYLLVVKIALLRELYCSWNQTSIVLQLCR